MTTDATRVRPSITISILLLRGLVALGFALAATHLWLGTVSVPGALALWAWCGLAAGFGMVVGRWWAVPLPPLLIPGSLWYALHTGHVRFLAVEWPLLVGGGLLPGLLGTALGVGLQRGRTALARDARPGRGHATALVPLGLGLGCLLAAVAPPGHVGVAFLDPRPLARLAPRPPVDPHTLRASVAAVPYTVYAATGAGPPSNAFRAISAVSDTYLLDYHGADRRGRDDVHVISSPTDLAVPGTPGDTVVLVGTVWVVGVGPPGRFVASARQREGYVSIAAPNRAVFERVAASVRPLNRSYAAGITEARATRQQPRYSNRAPHSCSCSSATEVLSRAASAPQLHEIANG